MCSQQFRCKLIPFAASRLSPKRLLTSAGFLHAAVLVQHKVAADGSTQPELTPCGQVSEAQREVLRRLVAQAKEDWLLTDHPNWSVRDMDSSHFLDSMQPGQVLAALLPMEVTPCIVLCTLRHQPGQVLAALLLMGDTPCIVLCTS